VSAHVDSMSSQHHSHNNAPLLLLLRDSWHHRVFTSWSAGRRGRASRGSGDGGRTRAAVASTVGGSSGASHCSVVQKIFLRSHQHQAWCAHLRGADAAAKSALAADRYVCFQHVTRGAPRAKHSLCCAQRRARMDTHTPPTTPISCASLWGRNPCHGLHTQQEMP
jgi:hypothetical protein